MHTNKIKLSLLAIIASFLAPQLVSANTYVFRNTLEYALNSHGTTYALITIYTNPIKAHQPVYGWRSHVRRTGMGVLGYDGDLIGYTNEQGVLTIAGGLTFEYGYCGYYINERYAVGSPIAPQSQPINFQIYIPTFGFGPRPPITEDCRRYEWFD